MATRPPPPDIGGVVRRKREALEMSRARLAELCGVSTANIGALERTPGRSVDLITAGALAKALGCSIGDLLESKPRSKSRAA